MGNRPAPEIEIDATLVRALLRDQAPDLADERLDLLDRGWDNTNWRLGADLVVRVPHRARSAPLIENEQRWLPEIAARVEIAIPAPIVAGKPSAAAGFPWAWSVVGWLAGVEAARAELHEPAESAARLGRFFHQLHVPAPDDAPDNPFRGQAIAARREAFDARLQDLANRIDTDRASRLFEEAEAARATSEAVWLHGDLHTRNMVVHQGRLSAVIDWGDITSGDRATDLAGAFMLVPDHINIVAAEAGADADAWQRARGWAVDFAILYIAHSADDPTQSGVGYRLLAALGVDHDQP